ncbi:MAG: PD40 domain-containing protein [Deltaproteobacteria bacterium]|nr:PD40 domain-containing protein [Deltaproteobacteria bacterium]
MAASSFWSPARIWTVALGLAIGVAAACSASSGSDTYGGGGQGASAGNAGQAGEVAGGAGADQDSDVDGSAGSAGESGSGGSNTGGTGGTGSGGTGTGGTSAGGQGGTGGWDNCQMPVTPDAGTPPPEEKVVGGAPNNANTMFAGVEDPNRAPAVVYPSDGVMMPPNINTIDIQFSAGSGNDLFEVRLESTTVNVRFYTKCTSVGSGCSLKLDMATFAPIAGKAAGQDPIMITVRGTDQASHSTIGKSAPVALHIAETMMLGGIYYWNASGLVVRYDFGKPNMPAENYLMGFGSNCVGCHSLSSKGHMIAVGRGIPGPSILEVRDVATKSTYYTAASNFQAFSPDESEIITSNGASLVWRESMANTIKTPNPLVKKGTMPDYHPDNTMIVFSKPSGFALAGPGINNGSLMLLPRNGNTWGAEQSLVGASNGDENNYYPAFSPDGSMVLYNYSKDRNSYLAPNSMVRVVATSGGTPIALDKANVSEEVGNSWPKWAPFKQCHRGKKLLWYTVSSARDYGYRIVNGPAPTDPDASDPRRWQIWMAAFDLEKAQNGQDPSYPAFWLPFQDMGSGNHIAQWTEKVVRKPCNINSDCPASGTQTMKCENNECVPQ